MLSLESACQQILSRVTALSSENVPVPEAYGRFLSEDIIAPIALPGFDNSAMDGYAVRSADVTHATSDKPIRLELLGRSVAGETTTPSLKQGGCIRVFTGAPIPNGADAVVMQEDTLIDADNQRWIWVRDGVKPWENVRFRGEDVKRESIVLSKGARITSARIGLASALGLSVVSVGRRPRVGLIATGSELKEPGTALENGKIYESNRNMIASLVERSGGIPSVLPLVPDSRADTQNALAAAFQNHDAVITSGGVSVGELDFVKEAFEALGGRLEFWRVAIKPGKPFVFGELAGKYLFGLPGNPVSALVTFLLLVRPALLHWQGAREVQLRPRRVRVAEAFENRGDRRHFMRARLDESGQARLAGPQASHFLGALAGADGLLDVPASTTIAPGTEAAFLGFEE